MSKEPGFGDEKDEQSRGHWRQAHNLKNVTVSIPKGRIAVLAGVSGGVKSSPVFDTIYNGAQRQLRSSCWAES